jgi:hypothetical protein
LLNGEEEPFNGPPALNRQDHCSAWSELFHQLPWEFVNRAAQDDPIEAFRAWPPAQAIRSQETNLVKRWLLKIAMRQLDDFRNYVHSVDQVWIPDQVRHPCTEIACSRTYFQHPQAWLQRGKFELGAHHLLLWQNSWRIVWKLYLRCIQRGASECFAKGCHIASTPLSISVHREEPLIDPHVLGNSTHAEPIRGTSNGE